MNCWRRVAAVLRFRLHRCSAYSRFVLNIRLLFRLSFRFVPKRTTTQEECHKSVSTRVASKWCSLRLKRSISAGRSCLKRSAEYQALPRGRSERHSSPHNLHASNVMKSTKARRALKWTAPVR